VTRVPRRVVYFSDSEGFGGAEQVLLQLLTGLDPREWTPVLFHHGATGLAPLVERARAIGVQDRVVPRMSAPVRRRSSRRSARRVSCAADLAAFL
jgi:hypothetical protein